MKKSIIFICLLFTLFLYGCAAEFERIAYIGGTANSYRQAYVESHPSIEANVKTAILNGTILLGMSKEEVRASVGPPEHINKSIGQWGIHEQWVYESINISVEYVYIENGKVTSWQE